MLKALFVLQVKHEQDVQEPVDVMFGVFNAEIGRMKRCIKYNVTVHTH